MAGLLSTEDGRGPSSALSEFLMIAANSPHRFGEWDCAMTVANWVLFLTGEDPAADLRGRYRTRLGWMRIVRRDGGLVALVGRLAERAGMQAVEGIVAGDVGVIEVPTLGEAGAIAVARGWSMKLNDGLTVVETEAIAVWGFR